MILIPLLWALIPTIIYLLILWWIDRYEKEPLPLLGIALICGVILSPLITVIAEKLFGLSSSIYPHYFTLINRFNFIIPIIEELSKGLVVLGIFLIIREEFDDILDGIVYGAIIGAGFAAVENFNYFYQMYTKFSSWLGITYKQFFPVLIGGWNHCFYSAIFGASLGVTRLVRNKGLKVLIPIWGIVLGIGFHALHDYLPVYFSKLFGKVSPEVFKATGFVLQLTNLAGIFIIFGVIVWAWEQGRAIMEEYLEEEVGKGVVSKEEYEYLTMPFYRQILVNIKNIGERMRKRKIYFSHAKLAYKKWHEDRKD